MAKRKQKKKPAKAAKISLQPWITMQRKDDTPCLNLSHFVASADRLVIFRDDQRPLIGMGPLVKMVRSYPSRFSPSLCPILGVLPMSSVWVWRIPKKVYKTPNEYMQEIMETGEIVCWCPNNKWRDMYLNRVGNEPWIVLAHETDEVRGERTICRAIGAFKPQWMAFNPSFDFPASGLRQLERMSEKTNGLFRPVNITLVTNAEEQEYLPLFKQAL